MNLLFFLQPVSLALVLSLCSKQTSVEHLQQIKDSTGSSILPAQDIITHS